MYRARERWEKTLLNPILLPADERTVVIWGEIGQGIQCRDLVKGAWGKTRSIGFEYLFTRRHDIAYRGPPYVFSAALDDEGNLYLVVPSESGDELIVIAETGESWLEIATLPTGGRLLSVPDLEIDAEGTLHIVFSRLAESDGQTRSHVYMHLNRQ